MSIKLGVIMDPIQTIRVKEDSTLAMLKEAQKPAQSKSELQYLSTVLQVLLDLTPDAKIVKVVQRY